jgi:hypothetical protein
VKGGEPAHPRELWWPNAGTAKRSTHSRQPDGGDLGAQRPARGRALGSPLSSGKPSKKPPACPPPFTPEAAACLQTGGCPWSHRRSRTGPATVSNRPGRNVSHFQGFWPITPTKGGEPARRVMTVQHKKKGSDGPSPECVRTAAAAAPASAGANLFPGAIHERCTPTQHSKPHISKRRNHYEQ